MSSLAGSVAKSAHALASSIIGRAPVQIGGALPSLSLKEESAEKPSVDMDKLTGKNIILGVPGAFTPSCSSHVPGYIEGFDKFKAKGINGIYVVSVNDAFVTKAWKEKLAPSGTQVHFLADDRGEFVSNLGLLFDGTGSLGGPRSKRFAIVAENGKVSKLAVEDVASDVKATSAESILSQL